ncbi:MAG: hypothetical protein HPY64_11335 [Anaerolineae bacterium]|nr:hypothetical protein [Anaerolineae bacterium]
MKRLNLAVLSLIVLSLAACGGVVDPVLPTAVLTPTVTPTRQPSPTLPPSDTPVPTHALTATGGPSPTSIIGPTRTPEPIRQTPTPRPNPNAPRIEYFTADPAYVYPGDQVTLFWSIRGADRAAIYRLDALGQRNQLWNVEPSGSLTVQTNRRDRGTADFLLTVDNGQFYVEQLLSVPLLCAYSWFFAPEPVECPDAAVVESTHIEQMFEGGRMIYVEAEDQVYVLFSDGRTPAWTAFQNRYVGGQTPDEDTNFVPPPGRYQPVRILGVIWRGSDPVRNRLALGLQPEVTYEGALQTATEGQAKTIYLRSADGSVLRLEAQGRGWGVIGAP